MKRLIFVTGNLDKLLEARQILKRKIDSYNIRLPEIQGTRRAIIIEKAVYAAKVIKRPVFVEDTALCFNALNGLPGPYIRDFLETIGNKRLNKLLHGYPDKRAKAVCSIGFVVPGREPKIFEGVSHGKIVPPRGRGDFGWSPIFLPRGSKKTYAQMSKEEKNQDSFRKKAFAKFKKYLDKVGY